MLSYASWELSQQQRKKKRVGRKSKSPSSCHGSSAASTDGANESGNSSNRPTLTKAVQKDLRHLRDLFVESFSETFQSVTTLRPGVAFQIFKKIAASTKLAGLHRFLPPKSDAAAYSQLLYASCLDLITAVDDEEKFSTGETETNKTPVHLAQNAFCFFALYLLHETNPLPLAPSEFDDPKLLLTTLPVGLTHTRANPRLLFRRQYRPLIRVDPDTCSRFLQWRELAQTPELVSGMAPQILLMDIRAILDRLWPLLNFAAYPGPVGLQALSQRQQQNEFVIGKEKSTENLDPKTASENDNDSANLNFHDSATIKSRLVSYMNDRGALRLPPPNVNKKFDRIRAAMQPMGTDTAEKLQRLLLSDRTSSETVETFSPPVDDGQDIGVLETSQGSQNNKNNDGDTSSTQKEAVATTDGSRTGPKEPFRLELAADIALDLRESLEEAARVLVHRHGQSLVATSPLVVNVENLSVLGGLSETMGGSQSVGTKSGIGRGALQALLERVGENETVDASTVAAASGAGGRAIDLLLRSAAQDGAINDGMTAATKTTVGQASTATESGIGRSALQALLGNISAPTTKPSTKKRQRASTFLDYDDEEGSLEKRQDASVEAISDVSSDSDDLLSASGGSTVGRRALQDLLAIAGKRKKGRVKNSTEIRSANNSKRQRKVSAPKPRPPRKSQRQPSDREESYSDDDDDESEDGDPGSVGHGGAALEALLSKAALG